MSEEPPRISERPVLSLLLIGVVAALVFAGVDLLLGGSVGLVRTVLFAVVFALAYVGVSIYRE